MRKKATREDWEKRFFYLVDKTDVGCWEWKGYKTTFGYGVISLNGKSVGAHRFSWALKNGFDNLIKGMCICHKCNNPSCVNPEHLYQGTHQDNANDKYNAGRDNPPNGIRNGKAKLNNEAIQYIRENASLDSIESQANCMIKFNVSQTTIRAVLKKQFWKHA